MEIVALFLIGYLLVSPDKASLALSRGVFGGARGFVTGKTPKAKTPSPRFPAFLAGWREGVTAARKRREAGRDTWTRGTRLAGRVGGGTANLARGINGSVQALRGREVVEELTGPATATSPDAGPASRGWRAPRQVRSPRTAPTSDASGLVVDQQGNRVTDPAPAPPNRVTDPAPAQEPAPPADEEAIERERAHLANEKRRAEGILRALRISLHGYADDDEHELSDDEAEEKVRRMASDDSRRDPAANLARGLLAHIDSTRARLDNINARIAPDAAPAPSTEPEQGPAAPVEPQATRQPSITTPASNGDITMPATTELNNVEELEREVKAMENTFRDLTAAMEKAKAHVKNLPERWAAVGWGTKGLDRAISDLAEEVAGIKLPALESFAKVRSESIKARTVGETAAAVQARGKTEAFRGA